MLDRFYPIVPDAAWVARIVPLGVKTVQLRVKDVPGEVVEREIASALAICRAHGCQLIVNDYWRQAIALGADFVHLGQEDLVGADLAAIRAAGLRQGISTHTHEE
jgi:thiamine-phosphate pyrophosphorylase